MQTIGVIRGGQEGYADSIKTGGAVLSLVPDDRYRVQDIFIDKKGKWYLRGVPASPDRILSQVGLVWNALHSTVGPQGVLDVYRTPYTGSDTFATRIGNNPVFVEKRLRRVPFRHIPRYTFHKDDFDRSRAEAVFDAIVGSVIVRPLHSSYADASIVEAVDDLLYALLFGFEKEDVVTVEEYIEGKHVSVMVVERYRGHRYHAVGPVEVSVQGMPSYSRRICTEPEEALVVEDARLSEEMRESLLLYAQLLHTDLGFRDYSRHDFVVRPEGVFYAKSYTHPRLGEGTVAHKTGALHGISLGDVVEHVLGQKNVGTGC